MRLIFLGSAGCNTVPAFDCDCPNCAAARNDATLRRTRAGLAAIGSETVLVDADPDLAWQLERERIRRVDRIFLTHWHFDHVGGLGELADPAWIGRWPSIDVYVPSAVAHHFDQELAYFKPFLNVHPIRPGDCIQLPDALWEVVKTTHTEHSVGFVIRAARTAAYLVDGVVPPAPTVERLAGCDLLITEGTLDELDEPNAESFSVEQAATFWQSTGIPQCILTHLSCHSWRDGRLVEGWAQERRAAFARERPGLTLAYDGLRVPL
jgi:phosphoribosyl 1,2-cyclic phosphate phosphodiesterase